MFLTLKIVFSSLTIEVPRPDFSVSAAGPDDITTDLSPSLPYVLPFWARMQAEADAELSTSESSGHETPPRPPAEMYFQLSAGVDFDFPADDSSSTN